MQETQEMRVLSLGREDPLEESMATNSRILVWRGAGGAVVHRVTKSQTQLKQLSTQAGITIITI